MSSNDKDLFCIRETVRQQSEPNYYDTVSRLSNIFRPRTPVTYPDQEKGCPMTDYSHSDRSSPFVADDAPRMSDVLIQLETIDDLTDNQRRDLMSAIRRACALIDRDPCDVPANINWFHVRLRRVQPASAGISKKTLSNIKSGVLKALALSGCSKERRDWLRPPSAAWNDLLERIPNKHDRWKLSQFAQYCTAQGVDPASVSDAHVRGLVSALTTDSFVDKPDQVGANAAKVWNRLRTENHGWPDIVLTVPRRRQPWTTPVDQFPESFARDVESWLNQLAHPDPLDTSGPVKPLRPATIKHRRFQIQEMASALLHQGYDITAITSLADLVEFDAFKAGLRYMMSRFGDQPTEAIHGLAMGLKAIATHHVKVDEAHLAEMKAICQRLNREVDGLREKNRDRLAQLDDPRNLAMLLHLPEKLVRLSRRPGLRPHKAALMLQAALCIETLLYAPMRLGNLATLHLERHLRRIKVGREARLQISIPGEEVKNGKPLHYELGPASIKLYDLYLKEARAVLLRAPSDYLFPAQDGGHKLPMSLGQLIKATILQHTGLTINAHLFRSIAAKIHMMANPGDFVTHAYVLGDDLKTAMKSYAQFEQKNALRHYQRSVDLARNKLPPGR